MRAVDSICRKSQSIYLNLTYVCNYRTGIALLIFITGRAYNVCAIGSALATVTSNNKSYLSLSVFFNNTERQTLKSEH